jgi:hypothetical protein
MSFFRWISHPWYSAYRQLIKYFSDRYKRCTVDLILQALHADAFLDLSVLVDEKRALLRKLFEEGSLEGGCLVSQEK